MAPLSFNIDHRTLLIAHSALRNRTILNLLTQDSLSPGSAEPDPGGTASQVASQHRITLNLKRCHSFVKSKNGASII